MAKTISDNNISIIMMFSKDKNSRTTIKSIHYDNIIEHIKIFFKNRIKFALSNNINRESIILDPGLGHFISSNDKYSFEIIKKIDKLVELNFPILIGPSRKSFLSKVSKKQTLDVHERDFPCSVCSSISLWKGVSIIRMHEAIQGRQIIDTINKIFE